MGDHHYLANSKDKFPNQSTRRHSTVRQLHRDPRPQVEYVFDRLLLGDIYLDSMFEDALESEANQLAPESEAANPRHDQDNDIEDSSGTRV
jgi:hypothetical protein